MAYKRDTYCPCVAAGLRQISVSKRSGNKGGRSAFFLSLEGREKNLPLAEAPLHPGEPEIRLASIRLKITALQVGGRLAKERKDGQDTSIKRITRNSGTRRANLPPGRGQLSLVEHALCPLDTGSSLTKGLIHETEYTYTDKNRNKKRATATVICPLGLSPGDEFFLWGLLALTFYQPDSPAEFYATPHYILKELGCLENDKGGENYRLFRQSLARLSAVTYQSQRFYDPIRGEHREVSFNFLSYSLPIDANSARAWRIVWNVQFFEFCKAAGGYLLFDLDTYRQLDFASRRLFLTLKKIFHRYPTSPVYEIRHICINVLGFAPSMQLKHHKAKLARCAERLAERDIIELPQTGVNGLFEKKGVGSYTIQFRRGRYFEKPEASRPSATAAESAMYEPLRAIGFDDAAIARIVKKYRPELIQTWTDITLAAKEKHGTGFFKRSPQAYFMDNIEKACQGTRTPPDWWHEYRKEEERRERESKRQVLGLPVCDGAAKDEKDADQAFEEYLRGEAREAVQAMVEQTVKEFQSLGLPAGDIARRAAEQARRQMRTRFRREHPEYEQSSGPKPLADILKGLIPQGPPCDSSPSPLFDEAGKAAFSQNLENRNTETQKGDKPEMQGCSPLPCLGNRGPRG